MVQSKLSNCLNPVQVVELVATQIKSQTTVNLPLKWHLERQGWSYLHKQERVIDIHHEVLRTKGGFIITRHQKIQYCRLLWRHLWNIKTILFSWTKFIGVSLTYYIWESLVISKLWRQEVACSHSPFNFFSAMLKQNKTNSNSKPQSFSRARGECVYLC